MPTNPSVITVHELAGYVTTTRAAQMLDIQSRNAVVKMIERGDLCAIWIGVYLIDMVSIERFNATHKRERRGRPHKVSA